MERDLRMEIADTIADLDDVFILPEAPERPQTLKAVSTISRARAALLSALEDSHPECSQCMDGMGISDGWGGGPLCWPCETEILTYAPEDMRGKPTSGFCTCGCPAEFVSDWLVSACPDCRKYHAANKPDDALLSGDEIPKF